MPSNPRVLYVDDDADSREMLCALLKSARIEVTAVATAAQALSFMKTTSFDVYLLDAWLPDLSGFELCRRMRDFDPRTPILFFSGAAYEADQKRGLEAGANRYVVKPDIEDLILRIKQFIPPAEFNIPNLSIANEQLNRGRLPCNESSAGLSLLAVGS